MHAFNIDVTVLHGEWESFSNMREELPELCLYHILTPHMPVWDSLNNVR